MEKLQKGKNLINRKKYKDLKRYDRTQLENFLINLYKEGYKDGAEAAEEKGNEVAELLTRLENGGCKGVGKATADKIRAFMGL